MAERNTTTVNHVAGPLHLSLFQDGGSIPPVTSTHTACKRSIHGFPFVSYINGIGLCLEALQAAGPLPLRLFFINFIIRSLIHVFNNYLPKMR